MHVVHAGGGTFTYVKEKVREPLTATSHVMKSRRMKEGCTPTFTRLTLVRYVVITRKWRVDVLSHDEDDVRWW